MVKKSRYRCKWLTVTQAVMESGVSYAQLTRAIRNGQLAVHELGNTAQGGYLIHPEELKEFTADFYGGD